MLDVVVHDVGRVLGQRDGTEEAREPQALAGGRRHAPHERNGLVPERVELAPLLREVALAVIPLSGL